MDVVGLEEVVIVVGVVVWVLIFEKVGYPLTPGFILLRFYTTC